MGHGGCLDRHIEAVDRNAVGDRPTRQQLDILQGVAGASLK